jgi:hypothetical protein
MSSKRKQLKRALLATSCLTAFAVGSAQASIYTEGPDLSNDPDGPTALASGVTQVLGTLNAPDSGDIADSFKLSGLTVGQSYTVNFSGETSGDYVLCLAGVEGCLGFGDSYTFEAQPSDMGMASLYLFDDTGDFNSGSYNVNISATEGAVPVAPSAALLGLGLAALVGKRRKHGVK